MNEGCVIYAIYSTHLRKVYVAQTGAEGSPKYVLERYIQYLGLARSYNHMYGDSNIKGA